MRCKRLIRLVCHVFADVEVSEALADDLLLEQASPPCIVEAAVELAEAQHFAPNLEGPAPRREPSAKEEDVHVSEGTVVLDEDR